MKTKRKNKEDVKKSRSSNSKYIYSSSHKTRSIKTKLYAAGIMFSLVIGAVGMTLIYAYNRLDSINYQPLGHSLESVSETTLENDNSTADDSSLLQESMVLNVALFGLDRRTSDDNHSRSDSCMIMSLDNRRKKIKLTSLMRDTWCEIPGHKSNRLNVAIAAGGEELAIKTIQRNFGIKIDRYATVDFESFKEIVDIIGGIDLSLSAREAKYINGDLAYYKSKADRLPVADGTYHLDGEKTLSYARARKVATPEGLCDDFARTYRQRRVLSTIVNKVKKCSISQVLGLIEKAGPYISTNLKKSEILTLGKNALTYLNYSFEEFRLPTDANVRGQDINGMSVLVIPDIRKAQYDLAKFIYEDSVKE